MFYHRNVQTDFHLPGMNTWSDSEQASIKSMSSRPQKGHDSILGLPISAKSQVLGNIMGSKMSLVVQSSGPIQWIDTPVRPTSIIKPHFYWPRLSTALPCAFCSCAQPIVGKGCQQVLLLYALQDADADAARGVCALESSSYATWPFGVESCVSNRE